MYVSAKVPFVRVVICGGWSPGATFPVLLIFVRARISFRGMITPLVNRLAGTSANWGRPSFHQFPELFRATVTYRSDRATKSNRLNRTRGLRSRHKERYTRSDNGCQNRFYIATPLCEWTVASWKIIP